MAAPARRSSSGSGTLIKVPGGGDGSGSFTGFVKEADGSLRHVSGSEWATLSASQTPTTMSESQFAVEVYHAPKITSPGGLAGRMSSPRLNSSIDYKVSGAPAANPGLPSAPSRPGPTHTEGDADAKAEEERRRREAEEQQRRAKDFVATLRAEFPWLDSLGIDPRWFQTTAAEASGTAEVLVKLRGLPQYKARFPGMYRSDGSVRMNEAQYMSREQDFRTLLRQYGFDVENEYQTPASLIGFFDSEMDPNEFQERLQTYRGVQQSSRAKKDAFYVYAGIELTDDALYEAVVDPAAAQRLSDEYNARVAAGSMDYQTWITRATEVGERRVAELLGDLQRQGAVAGRAVQSVLNVSSDFARQMMDAIYTGGTGATAQATLSLEDLLSSFEYAVIGSAASESGLALPSKERLAEIRQAGVERAQAVRAYTQYGLEANDISGAVQRAGYDEFTQDEFERAQFLGQDDPARQLQQGLAVREAAGRGSGEFRFAEDGGRLVQRGFGVR